MKILQHNLCILIVILFVNSSFSQTLKVSDFRKAFNYYKPDEHKLLLSKGFILLCDTISSKQKKFKFHKQNTNEIIELSFTEDGEGGEYLSIVYFLPNEFTYKNFILTLKTYKFKYSKRNSRYQLPSSSYSGENIYLNGLTPTNRKIYYSLKYDSYKDKALSGPRPEFKNQIVDSIIKTK
ncbi:hypothetical protein L1276_000996 [Flavobacterium sp. HSC-32F16]|uniref:hypothetical protein n=1 Tax=Flavobacterium sp. HSC-32F16 TaxID=2910964 RepID=UPI0020A605FF|nr:hypothetical protein [Flavobacterium sp. HSC-32F16]MCP2025856.1 hypothetical protein [Flavobacterium sp. HSC-32F16]